MRLIGLLGGTFDPVHFGHLRPAVELRERLALSELRLLPCNVSPLRAAPLATAAQRCRMLELAIAGHPWLRLDPSELQRPPPSYTVDTLEALRAELPDGTLVFAMGSDAFAGFTRWHRWQRILELAHLAVTTRPGFALQSAELPLGDDPGVLRERPAGAIVRCPVSELAISASAIRACLAQGRDASFLLPAGVHRYVLEQGIYAATSERYAQR